MDEFAIFKRFNDKEQAIELSNELEGKGIECQLIDDSPSVDITFTGNTIFQSETQLMIKQSDFERAYKILDEKAVELLKNANNEHYLFQFTNEELYEIITKPDEWSSFDYKLAQKILKDRGQDINEDLLISLKDQRIIELSKPVKGNKFWTIIGYISSVCGGLLGIAIGWCLWKMKKTLPNGEKVYMYAPSDRQHGSRMFIIGIVVVCIAVLKFIFSYE